MDEQKIENENEKILNFDALKRKCKVQKVKLWVMEKYEKTKAWVSEHPKEAIAGGLMALKTLDSLYKQKVRSDAKKAEERHRELEIWDPVLGTYHYLKAPLTKRQKDEFDQRVRAGESRREVLNSMHVLKR